MSDTAALNHLKELPVVLRLAHSFFLRLRLRIPGATRARRTFAPSFILARFSMLIDLHGGLKLRPAQSFRVVVFSFDELADFSYAPGLHLRLILNPLQ